MVAVALKESSVNGASLLMRKQAGEDWEIYSVTQFLSDEGAKESSVKEESNKYFTTAQSPAFLM